MDNFDEFWTNWIREGQNLGPKKKAKELYAKKVKTDDDHMAIMRALFELKVYRKAARTRGEWLPQPPHVFRWIRDERWEDEIPVFQDAVPGQSFIEKHSDTSWADPAPQSLALEVIND